jgi:hypothetical protein
VLTFVIENQIPLIRIIHRVIVLSNKHYCCWCLQIHTRSWFSTLTGGLNAQHLLGGRGAGGLWWDREKNREKGSREKFPNFQSSFSLRRTRVSGNITAEDNVPKFFSSTVALCVVDDYVLKVMHFSQKYKLNQMPSWPNLTCDPSELHPDIPGERALNSLHSKKSHADAAKSRKNHVRAFRWGKK